MGQSVIFKIKFSIIPIGATASNYNISFINGNLTVSKAPLQISVKNDTVNVGDSLPSFKIMYDGFKGIDNEINLENEPTVSCNATNMSIAGSYDLTLTGGSDKNYSFSYTNGTLVVKEPNGLNNINTFNITIYPVPTKNMLYIKSDMPISKSEIYTLDGRLVLYHSVDCKDAMNLSELTNGIYMLKLHSDIGITTRLVIKE